MFSIFTKEKTINIVIEDYAIRMVDYAGGGLLKVKNVEEKAIPNGLLEHGRILDEMAFYDFMKDTVRDWGIKRRDVRFYVPDSLVIMKKVELPAQLKENEIVGHFYLELGRTLYLPFDNPIFDVYPLPVNDPSSSTREGLLFAVPEEEINKYMEIFEDAGLKPIAADVRSIGIYRYFHAAKTDENKETPILFFELNLNSISISVFSNQTPEFIRYLDLDVSMNDWRAEVLEDNSINWEFTGDESFLLGLLDDQMIELERITNFYRYSLHKGEKMVSNIILLGDFPNLEIVHEKIMRMAKIPVEMLDAALSPVIRNQNARVYIPALGLALKGEVQ